MWPVNRVQNCGEHVVCADTFITLSPRLQSFCSVSAATSWAACHVRRAWLVWQDKVTQKYKQLHESSCLILKIDTFEFLPLNYNLLVHEESTFSLPLLSSPRSERSLTKSLQTNIAKIFFSLLLESLLESKCFSSLSCFELTQGSVHLFHFVQHCKLIRLLSGLLDLIHLFLTCSALRCNSGVCLVKWFIGFKKVHININCCINPSPSMIFKNLYKTRLNQKTPNVSEKVINLFFNL